MMHSMHVTSSDLAVPIALGIIGLNHIQEPIHRPEGIPLYQWFYCADGKGEFIIHNEKYILSKGEGALLYPDEPHSYHGITENWTLHFFAFSGSICADLLKTLHMPESNVYHLSKPELFPAHMEKLETLYQGKAANKTLEYSKEIYNFLLDLAACITRIDTRISVQENVQIKRIMTYLEEHYSSAFSLTALSDYMQLSKEYLCTLFKKEMKQTILQHLLSIRISHARIFLIQYPEKKSYEIGLMCGFESPNYFIKVFRRYVGCTPEEYRSRS